MPDFREWAEQEGCDFCVKLVRIIKALVLDFLIALAVLLIAKGAEIAIVLLFHGDLTGQAFQTLDVLLRVVTFGTLGGIGIWDAVIQARLDTSPPC
jgi:hypothetical protein